MEYREITLLVTKMPKCKMEFMVSEPVSPSALDINNGTKKGYKSKVKIHQKHWVYATGTCSLSC